MKFRLLSKLTPVILLVIAIGAGGAVTQNAPLQPPHPVATSGKAEGVYAEARSRIVQVRTLLKTAAQKSSTGSGFLVSADGLAITNFHVVSQHAWEPDTYRLEYLAPDGSSGPLQLISFDVINDLALVKLDKTGLPYFEFDPLAVADTVPKGESLYTLGNPLDIGFTVLEGTYSGYVDRSYNERVHLSGTLNPGMSGGPTLSSRGKVAGVNVSKIAWGAEQVSFLVPAKYAEALLHKPRLGAVPSKEVTRGEIGNQLKAWQATLFGKLEAQGFGAKQYGPYLAPESRAPWFTCWARTNSDTNPKPRARVDNSSCNMQSSMFIANDLQTGNVEISQSYVSSIDLNAFQFAHFLNGQTGLGNMYGAPRRMTKQVCTQDLIRADGAAAVPLHTLWCARAYRDFEGLYDITMIAVTQDRAREALVSRLTMHGVGFDNALLMSKRYLDEIKLAAPAPGR
jgi:S1-C subfamily serine protease